MSTDAPIEVQAWYKSNSIRLALSVVGVPLFIRIAQHTIIGQWLAMYLGIDILTMHASDIVDWLMVALSSVGGVIWIRKRVEAGKDPGASAPLIVGGAVGQLIGAVAVPPGAVATAETEHDDLAAILATPDLAQGEPPMLEAALTQQQLLQLMHARDRLAAARPAVKG